MVDLSRFRFDLTYRVVRSDVGNLSPSSMSAVFGGGNNGSGAILWYGDPVPGTLCSRNLHSCDQRTCILQSPNFPGLYPRWATLFTKAITPLLLFVLLRSITIVWALYLLHACIRNEAGWFPLFFLWCHDGSRPARPDPLRSIILSLPFYPSRGGDPLGVGDSFDGPWRLDGGEHKSCGGPQFSEWPATS